MNDQPTATNASLLQEAPFDAQRWEEFDTLYRPFIRKYARRYAANETDAEDITQEVLTRLYDQRLRDFSYVRGSKPGKFRAWLRAFTYIEVRAWQRKNNRPTKHEANGRRMDVEHLEALTDGESQVDTDEWRELARRAADRVRHRFTEAQFQCWEMREIRERSYDHISEQLGVSLVAARQNKSRVERSIIAALTEWLDAEPT